MRKIMAILHKDKAYVTKLMEYIKNQDGIFYEIIAFSEEEAFKLYAKDHPVTLLLCREEEKESEACKKAEKVLYLTESMPEEENEIFMYQSAKILLEKIGRKGMKFKAGKETDEAVKKQIIGVFSPYQGGFDFIIPELMALCGSRTRNVLFISMDPFYNGMLLEKGKEAYGISNLIYYMKQGKEGLKQKFGSCIRKADGIDLISGCEHYTDLCEITERESRLLFENLSEEGEHDLVILHFVCGTLLMEEALNECDQLYKISYPNISYQEKDRELTRQLLQSVPKERFEAMKTIEVTVPELRDQSELQSKILLSSSLGEEIRQLMERINEKEAV